MDSLDNLSKDEWAAWRTTPATKVVMEHLRRQVERLMFEWINGKLTGDTADKTLQLNSEAIGRAAAFGEVMNLSYEDIYPEVSDEAKAHIPYAEE